MPHPTTPEQPTVESWEGQQSRYQQIGKAGMQEYVSHIEDWDRAFPKLESVRVCCMDEGIEGGIWAAGSLILLNHEERVEFCLNAMQETGKDHVHITCHEGCGAAGIKYKEWLVAQGKDPEADYDAQEFDAFTQEQTQKLVEELNQDERLTGKISYDCEIHLSEMKRPAEQHVARVIYYDGSGHFDPSQSEALLPGFIISRRYQKAEAAQSEAALAAGIAFGGHGFSQKFAETNEPLMLIVIGESNTESPFHTQKLIDEAQEVLAQVTPEQAKYMAIDYCSVPA